MLKVYRCRYLPLLKCLKSVDNKKQRFSKNFCTLLRENIIDKKGLELRNTPAFIHVDVRRYSKEDERDVTVFNQFENVEKKDKKVFYSLVKYFEDNYNVKSGQCGFVEEAVKHMKAFGVHRDLKAYKKLLNLFPKDVYVAKNIFQVSSMSYPRQQFAVLRLLDSMEYWGVIPDAELGEMIKDIFGWHAHPALKYRRMLYWSTKFKNRSPWLLPKEVPSEPLLFGKLAVERITSVDLQTEISVFQTEEIKESIDKTWIVSGQSRKQKELLKSHSPRVPIIVEGGDIVWLRDKFINYFVLKADCEPAECKPPEDLDDLSKMQMMYFNPDYTINEEKLRSVHEQDDGIIYAVCVTGTSSKDSLLSWIRILQKKENPHLENVPILFKFRTADSLPAPFTEEVTNSEEKL